MCRFSCILDSEKKIWSVLTLTAVKCLNCPSSIYLKHIVIAMLPNSEQVNVSETTQWLTFYKSNREIWNLILWLLFPALRTADTVFDSVERCVMLVRNHKLWSQKVALTWWLGTRCFLRWENSEAKNNNVTNTFSCSCSLLWMCVWCAWGGGVCVLILSLPGF